MQVNKYSLGELQANCYLLTIDNQCLIIDPADEGSFILEEIQRRNLKLVAMLATHGHFDHLMAVGEIQLSFNVPLYVNKADNFLIDRLTETAIHFLGHKPIIVPIKNIENFKNKNLFQISNSPREAGFKFQILNTPGHTPGSNCFYFKEEGILFTGDTLFKDGVGRTDLSYSSKKDLDISLKKILALPEETIIYPGHGEEAIVDELFH
jgi:hydroxyacylglutathione hydrolase